MKVSFIVTPGCIDINHINVYKSTQDVLSFVIDTKQKYPEFCGSGDDYSILHLGTNEETLHKNDRENLTAIAIVGIDQWFLAGQKLQTKMSHSNNKYGFNICLWRIGKGKTLWESKG
jgi:hypothetical protein